MAVMIDPSSPAKMFTSVVDGLNKLYEKKCKPLEVTYRFGEFYSPLLTASDFNARPMVLLIGQYSVGKTTFIRHLLGRDFPGQHIGPEPTTDRFLAVMHGPEERIIPGNTLAVQADMPFRAVNKFGAAFLNKFQASIVPAPILEEITLIDTPGILAGEKQSLGRSYDFTAVTEWFAERSDLVLLLFDAHKLDISDELKRTIQSLKAHDDKIRIVLNKADTVDGQQLMRVYGALMWSLGKVVQTPEVMRVFIGSFWERPIQNRDFENLFKAERGDLFKEMHSLPRNSAFRKVNDLVKRARLAKVHAYILAHLKNEMPMFFGKSDKMSELIKNLDVEFRKIQQQFRLPPGDFPNIERFRLLLKNYDFDTFAKLNPKLIQALDDLLSVDIPNLLQQFPYGDTTPQRQLPPMGATTQPTSQIPQQQQGYQTQPTQPGFGAQPTAQLPAPTQPNQQGFQLYPQPQQLQQPQPQQLQQPQQSQQLQQPQQLQQSQQLQQPPQLQQAQQLQQIQQPPFNYQQPQQLQQSQQFPPQTYQPQFQQPGFSQPLPQQMFQQHQQFQQPQPSQSNPSQQSLFQYPTQQPQLPQSQQLQPLHPQSMQPQNQAPSQSQQGQPPRGLPSSMSQTQDPTDSNFFQATLGVSTYQQLKDQGPPSQALSAGSFAAPNLMDTELTGRPLPQTADQDSIVGIQNPFASR